MDSTFSTISLLTCISIMCLWSTEAALAPAPIARNFKAAVVSPSGGGASVSGGVAIGGPSSAAPAVPANNNFQRLALDMAGIKGLVRGASVALPGAFGAAAGLGGIFRRRSVNMDMASIVRLERSPKLNISNSEVQQGVKIGADVLQAFTGTGSGRQS